jgi:hypothetical protein
MHLILMLSQSLISYPLWIRLGKWSGMGLWRRTSRGQRTITKFQHALGNGSGSGITVPGVQCKVVVPVTRGRARTTHVGVIPRPRLHTHDTLLRGPFLSSLRITRIRTLRTHEPLDVSAPLFYICSFAITSVLGLAPFAPSLLSSLLFSSGSAPEMSRTVHVLSNPRIP